MQHLHDTSRVANRRGQIAWQAIGVLLAVFVAGALSGVVFAKRRAPQPYNAPPRDAGMHRPPDGPPNGPPPGGELPPGAPPRRRLPRQLEGLALTFEQNEQIRHILEEQKPHVDTLMAEIMPRLRARSDSTIAAIRRVLTDGQRARFDAAMPTDGMAPGLPGGDGRAGDRPPPPDGRGPPPPDGRRPPPPDGRRPPSR